MPNPARTRRASGKRATARMSTLERILDGVVGNDWGAAAHDIMDRAKSIELREHIDLERNVTWQAHVTWRNGQEAAPVHIKPHLQMWSFIAKRDDPDVVSRGDGSGWARRPSVKAPKASSAAEAFCNDYCPDGLSVRDCFRMRRDDKPMNRSELREWHAIYDRVPGDVGSLTKVCGVAKSRQSPSMAGLSKRDQQLIMGSCPDSVAIGDCARAYRHWAPEMTDLISELEQVEEALDEAEARAKWRL